MFDVSQIQSFLYFGLISRFVYDMIILCISPISRHRVISTSDFDKTITENLIKKISDSYLYSTSTVKTIKYNYPSGLIIGKWYIAIIDVKPSSDFHRPEPYFDIQTFSFHPIIDEKKIAKEMEENNKDPEIDIKQIETYRRSTQYVGCEYEKTIIKFNNKFCASIQNQIVDKLKRYCEISLENEFNYGGIFLITGNPGEGKSIIARILAQKMKASLCDDFELTSPGFSINTLVKTVSPTEEYPLILLIDEYDKSVERIHKEKVENHKWQKPPMVDKDSHNKFFDKLQDIDNTITILTSNRPLEWFLSLDKSFVRPGRINVHINVHKNHTCSFNLLCTGDDIASVVNTARFTSNTTCKGKNE